MPHITIEYSANVEKDVDVRALVHAIHRTAIESGVFELAAIRTRASRRDVYEIADGDPGNAFIHVDVNLAPGRDAEIRRGVAQAMLDVLGKATDTIAAHAGVALSVEVRQIDNATAQRRNNLHQRLSGRLGDMPAKTRS
jgi:5-carboxymethyl-2-hydroxymuconate isomerase